MDTESEALRAWKVSVAEWMGLDPIILLGLDVETYDDGTPETVQARAFAAVKADPDRAVLRREATGLGGDAPFSATWQLSDDQGEACVAAVGAKPGA